MILIVGIVGYEVFCPPGELLSQAMDSYRYSHPLLVNGVILYLAGHLTRVWPAHLDPLTAFGEWFGS
jgi:hypothetical protein